MQQNLSILSQDGDFKREREFIYSEFLNMLESFSPNLKDEFIRLRDILRKSRTQKVDLNTLNINFEIRSDLIRAFSLYLILVNIMEERFEFKKEKRDFLKESIDELKVEGFDKEDIIETLKEIKFYPTFTAHPTESRRRTFLEAHHEMSRDIEEYFNSSNKEAVEHLRYKLSLLWQSNLIRNEKIEVLFELDNLLYIIESSLLEAVVKVHEDVENFDGKLNEAIIKLGSWIGGDRDGNPFVTNTIMTKVMKMQHNLIIEIYLNKINLLLRELAINSNLVEVKDELIQSIKIESEHLSDESKRLHLKEPFRAKLSLIKQKLQNRLLYINSSNEIDFIYKKPNELIKDLDLMINSLNEISAKELKRFRNLVLVGGFNLLKLDFREHKNMLHSAIGEIFSLLGYADSDYPKLTKEKKIVILNEALSKEKINLESFLGKVTSESERLIEAFIKFEWARRKISDDIIDSFIISMSEDESDLLSALWFAKQANLWIKGKKAKISITPLFETIEDLKKASTIIENLTLNPHYKEYLNDREVIQEIMIGYSDSSKDGGIFASNFNLNRAIINLMDLGEKLGVKFLLFHGRGGSVSRGGGSTHLAVLSSPAKSVNSFLKVTEQGEVISSKYLNPKLAHQNLTQTLSALLKKSIYDKYNIRKDCGKNDTFTQIMQQISDESQRVYKELVNRDGFITYFKEATPIKFIEELNIGSRPSKRKKTNSIEDLRAIPWVFSWTQNRSIIPAWYGVGSGLEIIIEKNGDKILKECYKECPFFKTTIDNIAMALLKVDLDIAKLYNQFVNDENIRDEIWNMIEDEFIKTEKYILAIRDEIKLLENEKWLQESILLRKPYLTALNLLQIELIKEYNSSKYEIQQERLKEQIHSTIVGVAQGIRNTG